MRGFVFAVIFIIIFSTLLATVPAGLQGTDEDPETVIPIDPDILTGFAEIANYSRPAFYVWGGAWLAYEYNDLGSRDWLCLTDENNFAVAMKDYFLGLFWLGHTDPCKFTSPDGTDRGTNLDFTEIEADATEGTVRYALQFTVYGGSAGSLVVYWNTTTYPDPEDAWDNDILYFLHGVGFENTATNNIGALIVSLLFLQLPNVPVLVNIFLAVPLWATIIFVLWFIIKEMIPFV